MIELSILIPSRNEEWLNRTIQDLLENSTEATEVIAVLDGDVPDVLPDMHPRLTVIRLHKSVGQRAATNMAAKLSKAKWVAKTDAHCAFSKDFDAVLLADAEDRQTVVPAMRNLHVFDWVCEKGHRRYQGPSGPCLVCGEPTTKDVLWLAKESPRSRSYCFDSEPHFKYYGEHMKRLGKNPPDITESMSLQGSFFMITRKRYWDLAISDEKKFSSWGQQGIEVALKTWLTGGQVVCNNKAWYAHLFRTQGGDFTFPYENKHSETLENREKSRKLFYHNEWRKLVYPLSWLLERFWPIGTKWSNMDYIAQKEREIRTERSGIYSVENRKTGRYYIFPARNIAKDAAVVERMLKADELQYQDLQEEWNKYSPNDFWWHVEMFCREPSLEKMYNKYIALADKGEVKHPVILPEIPPTKGILYYTDGEVPAGIDARVKKHLKKAGLPITAVSLKPIDFGDRPIHFAGERGVLTMAEQILYGLRQMTEDVVFFCEHDCLYDRSCFDFVPDNKNKVYYNINVWKIHMEKNYGLKVDDCRQLSGMCAYRETLIPHYEERVRRLRSGESATKMGYEPGTHQRRERIDDLKSDTWKSQVPMLDLRTGRNLTKSRWNQEDFRNKKYTEGWLESKVIPTWGEVSRIITGMYD